MAEVSYDVPNGFPDAVAMLLAAQKLAAIEVADREDAIQTIFKLVDGVLASPEDVRKRRIKKANETFHQKAGRHPAAVEFLRCVGFLDGDDPEDPAGEGKDALLTMPVAFLPRLTDSHHTLAMVAKEAGIAAPPLPSSGFNPYQSSSSASDTTRSTKAPDGWKSEAEKLREEVKKRQREMEEKVQECPAVELRPSAFWLSAGLRLEEVIKSVAEQEEEKGADSALLQAQVAASKATIAGPVGKFESADRRRLAELSKKQVYQSAVLRVICPDKSVLQAHFRASTKGSEVIEEVARHLAPHVASSSWYLYESPPLKRLSLKDTLTAAGLTPGAGLYLGFDGSKPGPPYLEPSLVAQLGPAPLTQGVTGHSFSGEAMGWGSGHRLGGSGPSGPAGPAGEGTKESKEGEAASGNKVQ